MPSTPTQNSAQHIQKTKGPFETIFIGQERLGVLFQKILEVPETKKARARHFHWIDETLSRLGLHVGQPTLGSGDWSTYAIAVGIDFSGNYGVFLIREPIIKESP